MTRTCAYVFFVVMEFFQQQPSSVVSDQTYRIRYIRAALRYLRNSCTLRKTDFVDVVIASGCMILLTSLLGADWVVAKTALVLALSVVYTIFFLRVGLAIFYRLSAMSSLAELVSDTIAAIEQKDVPKDLSCTGMNDVMEHLRTLRLHSTVYALVYTLQMRQDRLRAWDAFLSSKPDLLTPDVLEVIKREVESAE